MKSPGNPVSLYCLLFMFLSNCGGHAQTSIVPPSKSITWNQALRQEKEWYSTAEAIHIADNLLLYQHNNGGWNKNIDMAQPLSDKEKEQLTSEAEKSAVSTIDNKATFTQMEYLAKVYDATGQAKYKEAFLRGLDYLLEAQYDNGGWPQFYPLRKGYYEHITYNDGAMIGVMELLRDIANNKSPYTFVDTARKRKASDAINKGLEVILKTQIKVKGVLTAWCAQHDEVTFAPAKARAYELPSISGGESIGIVRYLMEIRSPDAHVLRAVDAAISWMERVKITGIRLDRVKDQSLPKGFDLVVVPDATAPPLLARFYDIETNQPMFVGRDGIVRKTLAEIEYERRVGYAWYIRFPEDMIEKEYRAWKEKWRDSQKTVR